LLFLIGILTLFAYGNCDIYDFPKPAPFEGTKWHNPYAGLDSNNWKMGNFHAHCNVYSGLTDGKGTVEELYHTYFNRMEYDVLGISNYQQVEKSCDQQRKIRTYEHGYSPTKNHHIVIGTDKVSWMEYPLFQHRQHKQHVLSTLRSLDSNSLIAIAHPKRGNAYSFNDMQYLSDYDCIEAFNHLSTSTEHWDAALSSGYPAYLLANDDSHDHEDVFKSGRMATLIHAPLLSEQQIVSSIKQGKAFGVQLFTNYDETFLIHKKKIQALEKLVTLEVKEDVLRLVLSHPCDSIVFIGQHGKIKKLVTDTAAATYTLLPKDTYIRIEATFGSSQNVFFFNPVFRISDEQPFKRKAIRNGKATLLYQSSFGLAIVLLIMLFVFWERKRGLQFKKQR
jgi:hypothetical protein